MKDNLARALPEALAEQQTMAALAGHQSGDDPAGYLGIASLIVDDTVQRARRHR
jgi:hypothetical protein